MTKQKESEITITVNFDNIPDNIGKKTGERRLLSPTDITDILNYMSERIGDDADVVILCGYLPAFMWIQIGAELMDYPRMKIEYRARNGMSCTLTSVTGVTTYE